VSTDDTNDPQHWRGRAAQMRALALTMTGAQVGVLLTDLAADYDKLAERAAIRPIRKSRDRTASRVRRKCGAVSIPVGPFDFFSGPLYRM
jgi:hypothetical protein